MSMNVVIHVNVMMSVNVVNVMRANLIKMKDQFFCVHPLALADKYQCQWT